MPKKSATASAAGGTGAASSYTRLDDTPLVNTTGYSSLGERKKKRWILGGILTFVAVVLIVLAVAFLTNAFHHERRHSTADHGARLHAVGVYYYIGASLTVFTCSYVVVSYLLTPGAKQHPGSLVLWGSVSDLVFAIVIIVGHLWDGLLELGDKACLVPAFFVQTCILASITWFFLLSVDLYLSLTRPFHDPQANLKFYHLYAWGTSLLSAIILIGAKRYGQSAFAVCWVKQSEGTQFINWWNWTMFNIPWILYFALSVIALIYTRGLYRQGMIHSQRARERVLFTTIVHVLAYGAFYFVCGVLYWTLYFDDYESDGVLKAFALLISSRGILDAISWHYKVNRANDRLSDDEIAIDSMLRMDVMSCTTDGIIETAEMSAGADLTHVNEARYFRSVLSLRVVGSTTSIQFNFKSYAMLVFRHLRQQFGWSTEDYLKSFGVHEAKEVVKNTMKESSGGGGSSGSFLYFSQDRRCMVKTVPRDELKLLMDILPRYHEYFCTHPDSLIVRFLGAHSIKMYGRKVYLVVMENLLLPPVSRPLHAVFDLKGSTVSRRVLSDDQPMPSKPKTLKDLDWVKRIGTASLDHRTYRELITMLQLDSDFLADCGIMDYSVLCGISNLTEEAVREEGDVEMDTRPRPTKVRELQRDGEPPSSPHPPPMPFHRRDDGGILSSLVASKRDAILYVGVIDILQEYNFRKKAERFTKVTLGKDSTGISVQPPPYYSERFMQFMKDIFAPRIEDHNV